MYCRYGVSVYSSSNKCSCFKIIKTITTKILKIQGNHWKWSMQDCQDQRGTTVYGEMWGRTVFFLKIQGKENDKGLLNSI